MVRYQRAYEAAARMLTASDEMLDRLINNTGIVGR
jgi:flagellar hook-associated protein 1 FlgK